MNISEEQLHLSRMLNTLEQIEEEDQLTLSLYNTLLTRDNHAQEGTCSDNIQQGPLITAGDSEYSIRTTVSTPFQ